MSQQLSSHAAIVAELSTLYEISSLSNLLSPDHLAHDALEKALRLFGVRRFALWSGPPDARKLLAMSGLREEGDALARARARGDNVYAHSLGNDDALGLLFMEKATTVTPRERRVYDIFARRVEECLLTVHGDMERQKALEALRESEDKYRSLFEQSLDAVALTTVDGTLLDANPAYLRLHGLDAAALGHSNVRDHYATASDRDEYLRYMEQHGAMRDQEVKLRRTDGAVMDCLRTSIAIRDDTGQIVRLQTVIRDVTEQKMDQEELRKSEERFRSLFEHSMDAIWILPLDDARSQVNQAWLDLFGYTEEDVLTLDVAAVYANPEERVYFLRRMEDCGVVRDEVRFKKKDGTVFDAERTVVALKDESGATLRFQGILRDITQRKSDRAELERSHAELRTLAAHLQLVREKERAAVARELHDEIGQALSVINMDIASLRESLASESRPDTRTLLEEMRALMDNTVERLRTLYTNLMPGMLDDLGLAAAIEWQVTEIAKRSNIDVRISKLDEVTLPKGDVLLATYRTFQEALDNAVRHSGTTTIEVSVIRSGQQATILIDDNGRGITDDEQHSSSSMGLIGMRERLSTLGGRIKIAGTPGKGTSVRITVPLA